MGFDGMMSGWWFGTWLLFSICSEWRSQLINMFQKCWNHQPAVTHTKPRSLRGEGSHHLPISRKPWLLRVGMHLVIFGASGHVFFCIFSWVTLDLYYIDLHGTWWPYLIWVFQRWVGWTGIDWPRSVSCSIDGQVSMGFGLWRFALFGRTAVWMPCCPPELRTGLQSCPFLTIRMLHLATTEGPKLTEIEKPLKVIASGFLARILMSTSIVWFSPMNS